MNRISLFLLLCSSQLMAQRPGIQFEDSLSWPQLLAKVKQSNKYLFVDCYATWCGPCKYMAQNVFPLPEVGAYINEKFVAVSIQMDRTPKDPERIRTWYSVADSIAGKYGVSAYPTYIIFSPEGIPVHRFAGAVKDPEKFIAKVGDAFDPDKQYYTVIGAYREHLEDSTFLSKALALSIGQGDRGTASEIGDAYMACLKDPYSAKSLPFVMGAVQGPHGRTFELLLSRPDKVDSALGPDVAERFMAEIIFAHEIKPLLNGGHNIEWEQLSKRLRKEFGDVGERAALIGEIQYYRGRKAAPEFDRAMARYMDLYGSRFSSYDLNESAWAVFQVSHEKKLLVKALHWSHRSIAGYPDCDWEFLDTYANLLYKVGNTKEAIEWEARAIALAKVPHQKEDFQRSLEKMKAGQKTW